MPESRVSTVKYPDITVQLTGTDGNAMSIISTVTRALRKAGVPAAVSIASWAKQLVSGLDGLPLTRVNPAPLPDDHPDVEFDTDMAVLARMGRQLWSLAQHWNPKLDIPDDDLLCDFIPGCDSELDLAASVDKFARLADDIKTIARVA